MTSREELTDVYRQRIAFAVHEAGHAVACVALSGRVHKAFLDDRPRTEFDVMPAGREPEVTYAGPWAQARWSLGRRPGPGDMYRILAANQSDAKALCASGDPEMGGGVVPLLDRCWPAVEALAKQLFRQGEVTHSDVCAALGLTDDGGPGSLGLALIRSGNVPGSFIVTRAAL
jgi:hypothetical protein